MKTFNLEITPPWGPEVVPPDLFSTPFLRGDFGKGRFSATGSGIVSYISGLNELAANKREFTS